MIKEFIIEYKKRNKKLVNKYGQGKMFLFLILATFISYFLYSFIFNTIGLSVKSSAILILIAWVFVIITSLILIYKTFYELSFKK